VQRELRFLFPSGIVVIKFTRRQWVPNLLEIEITARLFQFLHARELGQKLWFDRLGHCQEVGDHVVVLARPCLEFPRIDIAERRAGQISVAAVLHIQMLGNRQRNSTTRLSLNGRLNSRPRNPALTDMPGAAAADARRKALTIRPLQPRQNRLAFTRNKVNVKMRHVARTHFHPAPRVYSRDTGQAHCPCARDCALIPRRHRNQMPKIALINLEKRPEWN